MKKTAKEGDREISSFSPIVPVPDGLDMTQMPVAPKKQEPD